MINSVLALILIAGVTGVNRDSALHYVPATMPSVSQPAWDTVIDHNRSAERVATVRGGLLTVYTAQPEDNLGWAVGTYDSAAGNDQWRIDQAVGATIDFRVRVPESSPSGTFHLSISDGQRYWSWFFSDREATCLSQIAGQNRRAAVDMTAFRSLRVAVRGNRASLYLADREEPLISQVLPSGTVAASPRHALSFGEMSSGARGRFDLSSLTWTTRQAIFAPPDDYVEPAESKLSSLGELRRQVAKTDGGPSVLFMGFRHHNHSGAAARRIFLRELSDEHEMRVAFRELEFGMYERPGNVDPTKFSNYEVLVYMDPVWAPEGEDRLTDTFMEQWKATLKFVEDGGGLLFMPLVGETYLNSLRMCFEDLGLMPLNAIPVDVSGTKATAMQINWSYTDRIDSSHPVTQGVRGLWVPTYASPQAEVWNDNSVAVRVSDAWSVPVRFNTGVQFAPYRWQGSGAKLPTPNEADQQATPMLAVRTYGKGRIAFLALPSAYHVLGGRAPAYQGIFLDNGLKSQPSDGEQLLVNTLNWLGEAARKNPNFGGAETEPDAVTKGVMQPLPPDLVPKSFPAQEAGYRGVIGALSPRSGGESTVAEFADSAKRLGFDFLVVLDDYDKVTQEQYDQTNAEAKAASGDDFVCIAGLRMRDEVGNRFVAFRRDLKLPTESMLAPNGRLHTVIRKGDRSSGSSGLGLAKWIQANGHRTALVHYRNKHDRESSDPYEYGVPAWDVRPYRAFHSVFTFNEDGEQIDDMIDEHKVVIDDGQHVHPVSVTFLKHANDLQRVADGDLPHTVRWLGRPLAEYPNDTWEEANYLPTHYASFGPTIRRWQLDSRDLVSNGEYWDWTKYNQRWAVGVDSNAGLDAVQIWDGSDLIRHWRPKGAKRFDAVVTVNKDQQTMPLLVVTDMNGKRAISSGFQWRSHNLYASWCTDRVNTLSYCGQPSPFSPWGDSSGTYPIPTQPKGPMWDNLRLGINLDVLRFPGFDGQANGNSSISPQVSLLTADGQPELGRLYRHITWPMSSHEAVVQEQFFDHKLLPEQTGPHGWSTCGPIIESDVLKGKLRYTTFVHTGHRPAPIVVEGEFTFQQDVVASPTRMPLVIALVKGGNAQSDYRVVAVQRTGGDDHIFPMYHDHRDRQTAEGKLPYGAMVWFFPSMFGPMGLISLDDQLHYRLDTNTRSAQLFIGEPGRTYHKGETVKWKYLAVTSGFNDHTGVDTPNRIIDQLGIDGAPSYKVHAVNGQVVDNRYILTLSPGSDSAAFRGTLAPDMRTRRIGLPAALPLMVEGLCNNWTVVFWTDKADALRPIPVAEGKAYAHLPDLREDHEIFIGHPYVCNDRQVMLTFVQTGDQSAYLNVHNPTDQIKQITVRRSVAFSTPDVFDEAPAHYTWTLEPGGDRHVQIGPETAWTPVTVENLKQTDAESY